ncbi:hypothetical protein L593_01705 [Salinarchaeum sp. Harcht-Bsk1]|uniref:DUF2891 domain-containing protein n=1 Tax=Salinarchaeum sp. Harcht-Bsk1 TaxID=1333523 RepID=UPI0003423712|nr:DUF2891 domain-containing protein [Salinarchaeum sp. Harcht-Bsk1]AGN00294.1 hypothetical protein L593_01705 [Salinarchaeum sp. Harcht-Bsk1]
MTAFTSVEATTLLSGTSEWMGTEEAAALAHHPLESIETEFPHYVGSVDAPDDEVQPKADHPVFYGCFDWHSAVHSHWALVRQLRLFEDHPERERIVASIDDRLTPAAIEAEVGYFEEHPTFEKPYGWAWLLQLAAELSLWDDDLADGWQSTLASLEEQIRALVESEFLTQDEPFRVGTHQNTAFALGLVLDYARTVADESLASAVEDATRGFYLDDRSYPVEYEPLGWDFLSPALAEADLLRRVLAPDEFAAWVDDFFPDLTIEPYDSILDPIEVDPDPDDGLALHFVGLNVSKAWALAGLASTLEAHPYSGLFDRSAQRHAEAGLEVAFTDDYAGAHWLSSFVLYLLTRDEGGIAPAR